MSRQEPETNETIPWVNAVSDVCLSLSVMGGNRDSSCWIELDEL